MSFDPTKHYQDPEVAERYDTERFASLSGRVFQWAERRAVQRILTSLPDNARVLDAPACRARGSPRLCPRRPPRCLDS